MQKQHGILFDGCQMENMKKTAFPLFVALVLSGSLGMVSCGSNEQRSFRYVTPVEEHNRPVDSLMMEMEGLMEQYAALESRGRNGEDVMQAMRAMQSRITDFGLKMETVMHDMSEEDIDRFNQFYDDCLRRMDLMVDPIDSFDVAF